MIYRVLHVTEYAYSDPVPLCHNLIRLRPRDTPVQTCHRSEFSITPAPAVRRDRSDFFGNHVTWVSLQESHDVLRIEARCEVTVAGVPLPADATSPPWEQAAARLAGDGSLYAIKEFTFDSPYVECSADLAAFARPSFAPGRPLLTCVLELTQRIYREFTFDSGATTVGTPVAEVLQHRRGVCQDFAHLQIGCLRSLGLAARYISGYVVTRPAAGKPRLLGADASHAWLSVYIPDLGWVDFDPTNGVMPCNEHVTIGWARDYSDISPVEGVTIGGHRQSMYVGVDVDPVPLSESAEGPAPDAAVGEVAS